MPLPLLPGLMGGGAEPSDDDAGAAPSALADLINSLDDSQVQELVATADAFVAANPEEATEPDDGDEGLEGDTIPAPGPEDDEEPTDVDAAPAPEDGEDMDDAAAGGLEDISAQVAADAEESDSSISALQEMASGDSPAAPVIGKLAQIAGKLQEMLVKAQKAADKAIAKEDVQAAAQAGIDCRQALEAIQALEAAATQMNTPAIAPAATPQDHPALKAWGAVVQRKLPALGI